MLSCRVRAVAAAGLAAVALSAHATRLHAAPGVPTLTGYAVTSWTDADGVPLGAVYAIVQDHEGYLWVGTNAGLLRFDGVRFTHWNAIGEKALPTSPVLSLSIAADGALWAGLANGAGVYRIHGQVAEPRDASHNLPGSVIALVEDAQQTIWAAADGFLYRLGPSGWERLNPMPERHSVIVTNLFLTKHHGLLVGTNVALLAADPDRRAFSVITDGWAWAVSEDASGKLWVTDTVAGFRQIKEVRRPRTGFERNGYRLLHDHWGNVWLATIGEGLLRVGVGGDPVIERATLQTGLMSDSVQSLFEDREGNLWAGTTVGLHRLLRQKLTPMANVGLVTSVEATGDGDLWVGTNYGVVRLSIVNGRWQPHRISGPPIWVHALMRDRAGALWVTTADALWRVSGERLTRVLALPPSIDGGRPASLASDARGGFWIGDGSRLFYSDGTHLMRIERPGEGKNDVWLVYSDRSGRLWTSFSDGSVCIRSTDGTFLEIPPRSFGSDQLTVDAILQGADQQRVWFGTSVGLSRLEGGQVTTLDADRGVPGRIWSLTEDERGYLWAGVDLGVIRFTPEEFAAAVAMPSHRFRYELYDATDGLAGAPILLVRSGKASDGKIWFIRGGALTTVDPNSLEPVSPPGPVRIEAAVAEGRRFLASENLSLPAGVKRLDLNYTSVALTYPHRIRFRYRLDGFDTSWNDAGTRRTASYTNLPPRTYSFRVEADTDDGAWHAAAAFAFAIRPAFYQTWWFYGICVVAVATSAWGAWRVRRELDRQKYAVVLGERARLSRDIHDTLLQSMVGVSLQLDDLAQDSDRVAGDVRGQLRDMRRQLETYMRDARQSIKNLRSPLLETQDLVAALREIGGRATAGTSVSFKLTTAGDLRRCSSRVENEVLRIAQEALTNSMRHAHPSSIEITLQFDAKQIALSVYDDGCGAAEPPDSEPEAHYGILSMTERAESLGGRFTMSRLQAGGTQVLAVIPA